MRNQVFVGVSELSHLLARLGVAASTPTVRRWIDGGKLRAQVGPGGRLLVRVQDAATAVGLTPAELLAAGRPDEDPDFEGDDENETNFGFQDKDVEFGDE